MDIAQLDQNTPRYPTALRVYLREDAPSSIATLGNLDVLRRKKLALFCSVKCPGKLILQAHDLARELTQAKIGVIGGFHSPVEKECLRILLRGSQPVIVCPARSLKKMRIRSEWRKPLENGRLLFLSLFPDNRHRGDSAMALYRNRVVAALADFVFVVYAAPLSKTENFCREILSWQKPLYTLPGGADEKIITFGAKILSPDQISTLIS